MNRGDVQRMFDAIAPTYDLLNRTLSLGIDVRWRKRLLRSLGDLRGRRTLDVACGSGDLMLACLSAGTRLAIGADIAHGMLLRAEARLQDTAGKHAVVNGAAEGLPFRDHSFDVVTVAFGVRNFQDPSAGLREMFRVLVPGGQLRILEFSEPAPGLWGRIFKWYFREILPRIGAWVSGHPEAYQYLHDSVQSFPSGPAMISLVEDAGFTKTSFLPFSGGIATLYQATRSSKSDFPAT